MRSILLPAILLCLAATLSGCGIYKLSVRQGNLLDEEAVAQLEPGLSRQQVEGIMGTPLVQNPFDDDRWYYVYYFRNADDEVTQRTVTVYFEQNRVARITDRGDPNAGSALVTPEDFLRSGEDLEVEESGAAPAPPPNVPDAPET